MINLSRNIGASVKISVIETMLVSLPREAEIASKSGSHAINQ
jgi:hypothetical protein